MKKQPTIPPRNRTARLHAVCPTCFSDNIYVDSWAAWDPDTQGYVLHQVFDDAWCEACQATATIQFVSITQTS